MTLEKAIEILGDMEWDIMNPHFPDNIKAVKLGIEALKLVQELQSLPGRRESFRLPGEDDA